MGSNGSNWFSLAGKQDSSPTVFRILAELAFEAVVGLGRLGLLAQDFSKHGDRGEVAPSPDCAPKDKTSIFILYTICHKHRKTKALGYFLLFDDPKGKENHFSSEFATFTRNQDCNFNKNNNLRH
jgi:hypothetical protein